MFGIEPRSRQWRVGSVAVLGAVGTLESPARRIEHPVRQQPDKQQQRKAGRQHESRVRAL